MKLRFVRVCAALLAVVTVMLAGCQREPGAKVTLPTTPTAAPTEAGTLPGV